MRPSLLGSVLLLAGALLWCRPSSGSIENPGVSPLGEAESFTANTGVAGGPSTGAVYFNPARLTLLTHPRLSVSGTAYALTRYNAEELAFFDGTALPYKASGFEAIPSTLVSIFPAGEWTIAASVLVPNQSTIENQQRTTTPNTTTTLLQLHLEQDLWLGLSAARIVAEGWSLGVSVFGVKHSDSSLVNFTIRNPTSGAIVQSTHHERRDTVGFTAIVGVLYDAIDGVDLGLTLRLPLVNVTGSAQGYESLLNANGAGAPTFSEAADDNLPARYESPWELALGARWYLLDGWRVLTDVTFRSGLSYQTAQGSRFAAAERMTASMRVNLATEIDIDEDILAAAGFLYSPSVYPKIAAEGDATQNYFGITAGATLLSGRVQTGIGGFYLWSSGRNIPVGGPTRSANFSSGALGAAMSFSYLL